MMNISSVNTTAGTTTDKSSGIGSMKDMDKRSIVVTEMKQSRTKVISNEEQEQSKKTLELIMQTVKGPNTTVERSVHEATNHILYKVKDKETGEVIREIPEEKLLDIVAKIMEISGLLIDEKV